MEKYPGKIVSVSPSGLFISSWRDGKYHIEIKFPKSVNTEDTYMSIFNIFTIDTWTGNIRNGGQYDFYKMFKSHPNVKIVWEAKTAVNRRTGYGKHPRNQLVIWEYVNE